MQYRRYICIISDVIFVENPLKQRRTEEYDMRNEVNFDSDKVTFTFAKSQKPTDRELSFQLCKPFRFRPNEVVTLNIIPVSSVMEKSQIVKLRYNVSPSLLWPPLSLYNTIPIPIFSFILLN